MGKQGASSNASSSKSKWNYILLACIILANIILANRLDYIVI